MAEPHSRDLVDIAAISDPGSRKYNEDNYLAVEGGQHHLLAVCDGMGGHAAGEVASMMAVELLEEQFCEDPDLSAKEPGKFLNDAINAANYAIFNDAQENTERKGMGSTCVVALLHAGKVSLGHVGDSRGYLIRSGAIRQLTRDHSFVEEMVKAGMITPHETHTNPQRNVILQSLGRGDGVKVEVTEDAVTLHRGDYILLCSDGLTAVVADQEIAELVTKLQEPQAICEELVDLTNRRGGPDNVTVVLARFEGESADGPLIAVVCDNEESNDLYQLLLHRDGYRIQFFKPLDAALDLQVSERPRMVIIEHAGGFETAGELARQLRAQDNLLNVPILVVADDLSESRWNLDEHNVAIPSDALITDLIPTVRRIFDEVMRRIYLLVEHQGDVDEIRDSFRYNGYAAKCYTTLSELTEAAEERAPDLVLVNVTEEIELVCASLKMDAATAQVPIVLTGEGVVSTHREAHMLGADYYLTKINDIVSLARMLIKDGQ